MDTTSDLPQLVTGSPILYGYDARLGRCVPMGNYHPSEEFKGLYKTLDLCRQSIPQRVSTIYSSREGPHESKATVSALPYDLQRLIGTMIDREELLSIVAHDPTILPAPAIDVDEAVDVSDYYNIDPQLALTLIKSGYGGKTLSNTMLYKILSKLESEMSPADIGILNFAIMNPESIVNMDHYSRYLLWKWAISQTVQAASEGKINDKDVVKKVDLLIRNVYPLVPDDAEILTLLDAELLNVDNSDFARYLMYKVVEKLITLHKGIQELFDAVVSKYKQSVCNNKMRMRTKSYLLDLVESSNIPFSETQKEFLQRFYNERRLQSLYEQRQKLIDVELGYDPEVKRYVEPGEGEHHPDMTELKNANMMEIDKLVKSGVGKCFWPKGSLTYLDDIDEDQMISRIARQAILELYETPPDMKLVNGSLNQLEWLLEHPTTENIEALTSLSRSIGKSGDKATSALEAVRRYCNVERDNPACTSLRDWM